MLSIDAAIVSLNSASDCCAESPSVSAREKLAIMPVLLDSRSLASFRLYPPDSATTFTTPISAALDQLAAKGEIAAGAAPVFTLETSDSETGAAQLNSVRVFGLSTS